MSVLSKETYIILTTENVCPKGLSLIDENGVDTNALGKYSKLNRFTLKGFFWASDQVRHKSGRSAKVAGLRVRN